MRKCCLALLLFFALPVSGITQQRNIEEVKRRLQTAKEDTAKVKLLTVLGDYYIYVAKDSALHYIQQGLLLSKRLDYPWGIINTNRMLCYSYTLQNNYPRALEYGYKALSQAEEEGDSTLLGIAYNVLAHVHRAQKNYPEALSYYKKFNATVPVKEQALKALSLSNIASVFIQLKQADSALRYAEESYQLYRTAPIKPYLSWTLRYLAEAQFQLGNRSLGEAYLKMALDNAKQGSNLRGLGQVYNALASHFSESHTNDSALYYARIALPILQQVDDKAGLLDSYTLLTRVFQNKHQLDSAFLYQSTLVTLNNEIAAQNSVADLQNISFEERMREQEKRAEQRKEAEERKRNLQYAAITLGMVALLMGFLVLSHSILANQKLIRFLGVISLLIVFEFMNLLLHPWLAEVTHESPVLMLLIMVGLAAVLVPVHHRLEHWITHRLVEKNNRIRLAAAKKTIAQLEGNLHA